MNTHSHTTYDVKCRYCTVPIQCDKMVGQKQNQLLALLSCIDMKQGQHTVYLSKILIKVNLPCERYQMQRFYISLFIN